MLLARRELFRLSGCALAAGFAVLGDAAQAQDVTREQLEALILGEADLQGFARALTTDGVWRKGESNFLAEKVSLNRDLATLYPGLEGPGRRGVVSSFWRGMESDQSYHYFTMIVRLCDTAETAVEQLQYRRSQTSGILERGALTNSTEIGDLSYASGNERFKTIICQFGKVMADIHVGVSPDGMSKKVAEFPPEAVEALAHLLLLRAARQPELTGVEARKPTVTVNGRAMPAGKCVRVGKRVYVPVSAFAPLAGAQARWDATTGELHLVRGGLWRTLRFGDGKAKTPQGASAPLKVPLLKDGGEPVLLLDDLVMLLNGRVTQAAAADGDAYHVSL